jgi:hypothetical protein
VNSGEIKKIANCRLKGSGMIDRRGFLIAGGALIAARNTTDQRFGTDSPKRSYANQQYRSVLAR